MALLQIAEPGHRAAIARRVDPRHQPSAGFDELVFKLFFFLERFERGCAGGIRRPRSRGEVRNRALRRQHIDHPLIERRTMRSACVENGECRCNRDVVPHQVPNHLLDRRGLDIELDQRIARQILRRTNVGLLAGIDCKVNLIALNPGPGIPFFTPLPERVESFQTIVKRALPCFVRKPRGLDVFAACGQLKRMETGLVQVG